jgi:hypothetical protein
MSLQKERFDAGFPDAIRALKHNMIMLKELGAPEALAAISLKMVDVFEASVAGEFDVALSDLWGCSSSIHSIIYRSLVEKLGKESKRAASALCAEEDKDFRRAYEEYYEANVEISSDTGFAMIFRPRSGPQAT